MTKQATEEAANEVSSGGSGPASSPSSPSSPGSPALSHWPDAADLQARLRRLATTPMRPLGRQALAGYVEQLERRCPRSRSLFEQARQVIPGGIQHNLSFNFPFPLAMARADGPYLWDVDGNRYTDLLQAGGPTLLGNNYPPVRDRIIELLHSCGPATGMFHPYELQLATLIRRHVPSVESFRMLGSGTEACMAAIRAARTFTGKARVIKAGGGYHGWSDQLVYGLHVPGSGALEAVGIPAACLDNTDEFLASAPADDPQRGLRALLTRNTSAGGTAAVMVEPVGPESGTHPVPADYNQQVRRLCDEFGALLIFDEVVSGFRLGLGGAQQYFGVRPDLTVFGKCVAGGYPAAGGLGGRADVMAALAAGVQPGQPRAYVGGTLSANGMSCAAGYHAIEEMEKHDAPARAGRAGDRLRAGLEQLIAARGLPFVAYNQGSICHLETAGAMFVALRAPGALADALARKTMMEEMSAAFLAEGIVTVAGSRLYTSMADSDPVIDAALEGFARVFDQVA
jgi:glutamate-1-semialdehyde 2,1-aminomutase